ncbi:hypothetical protein ILYODFUR_015781 [Ilyodon furcidens]|uniref:MADF domain-containing protein n=1 Tax=Ilyodon furcidens TaxID=33524 RepID=A0ABV0TZ40_9TELE
MVVCFCLTNHLSVEYPARPVGLRVTVTFQQCGRPLCIPAARLRSALLQSVSFRQSRGWHRSISILSSSSSRATSPVSADARLSQGKKSDSNIQEIKLCKARWDHFKNMRKRNLLKKEALAAASRVWFSIVSSQRTRDHLYLIPFYPRKTVRSVTSVLSTPRGLSAPTVFALMTPAVPLVSLCPPPKPRQAQSGVPMGR